jgi:hypothetical protein
MAVYLAESSNISTKDMPVTRTWIKIEFSLFLIGELLSIPCYLFIMYHFLVHKTTRQALHNHVIILLLIFNFIDLTIDLSMTMSYSLLGYVSPFSPIICLIWQFVDYGIWYGSISLMFWASVERHILVFHSNLIRTPRRRFFVHYIPLAFFSLYTPILYFFLIFIYPCDRRFVKTSVRCGSICYINVAPIWFIYYDSLANYVIPILLIAVFSSVLILRFLQQKRSLIQTQGGRWRQYRKMIIQLSFVSLSYLIFDLPYIIIVVVQSSGYPDFGSDILTPYISRLVYVPAIVLPYATLLSLSRLKHKLAALLVWTRNRQVIAPSTIVW